MDKSTKNRGVEIGFGHDQVTVVFEVESASIQLDGKVLMVKTELPGFPPLAATQDLKNHLADVFDGKLSVSEARAALTTIRQTKPPYPPLVVWLDLIILSDDVLARVRQG